MISSTDFDLVEEVPNGMGITIGDFLTYDKNGNLALCDQKESIGYAVKVTSTSVFIKKSFYTASFNPSPIVTFGEGLERLIIVEECSTSLLEEGITWNEVPEKFIVLNKEMTKEEAIKLFYIFRAIDDKTKKISTEGMVI